MSYKAAIEGYVCENCNETYIATHFRQRFCSKKCSNSKVKRRTKRVGYCTAEGCNNEVKYYLNKFCQVCIGNNAHWARNSETGKPLKDQTIAEASHKRAGGANAYDNIRSAARTLLKEQINAGCGCTNCGWKHHVHVCHIKAIKDFPKETLVSEVNNLSNLLLLCPNCHWLFDNRKLVLPEGFEPPTKELCLPL